MMGLMLALLAPATMCQPGQQAYEIRFRGRLIHEREVVCASNQNTARALAEGRYGKALINEVRPYRR